MNDNEVDAVYSGVRDVFILTIPDYMRKFIQIYYGIHLYDYIWLTMCLSGKQNFVKLFGGLQWVLDGKITLFCVKIDFL